MMHYSLCPSLPLSPPVSPPYPLFSPTHHHLTPPELSSVSLGWPGPFCPASDLHEQVCQLVWRHAPGPLSDEAGPGPVQRPGVHTAEEVQGYREAITLQSPPLPGHNKERARGRTCREEPFHGCMDGSGEKQMGLSTRRTEEKNLTNV